MITMSTVVAMQRLWEYDLEWKVWYPLFKWQILGARCSNTWQVQYKYWTTKSDKKSAEPLRRKEHAWPGADSTSLRQNGPKCKCCTLRNFQTGRVAFVFVIVFVFWKTVLDPKIKHFTDLGPNWNVICSRAFPFSREIFSYFDGDSMLLDICTFWSWLASLSFRDFQLFQSDRDDLKQELKKADGDDEEGVVVELWIVGAITIRQQ